MKFILLIIFSTVVHAEPLPISATRIDPWANPLYQQELPESRRMELVSESTQLVIDFPTLPRETQPDENTTLLAAEYGPNEYTLTIYHDPAALQQETELPVVPQFVFHETLQARENEKGGYQTTTMNYEVLDKEEDAEYTEYFLAGKLRPEIRFITAPAYTQVQERIRVYVSEEVIYILHIKLREDYQQQNPSIEQVVPPLDQDPFISTSVFFFL